MLPAFLVPETVIQTNGQSPVFDLGADLPARLLVTFGITKVVEQESLELAVLASVDAETWLPSPVLEFPQKFYAGASALLLDLARHPGIRYLRARWTVNRWGRGELTPLFAFYVFVELAATPVGARQTP
jgi:hypothetical protein